MSKLAVSIAFTALIFLNQPAFAAEIKKIYLICTSNEWTQHNIYFPKKLQRKKPTTFFVRIINDIATYEKPHFLAKDAVYTNGLRFVRKIKQGKSKVVLEVDDFYLRLYLDKNRYIEIWRTSLSFNESYSKMEGYCELTEQIEFYRAKKTEYRIHEKYVDKYIDNKNQGLREDFQKRQEYLSKRKF